MAYDYCPEKEDEKLSEAPFSCSLGSKLPLHCTFPSLLTGNKADMSTMGQASLR